MIVPYSVLMYNLIIIYCYYDTYVVKYKALLKVLMFYLWSKGEAS